MNKIDTTPGVHLITSILRQTGHNGYTAICEFIDNAIEKDVRASICDIVTESNNDKISRIIVSDNGRGIPLHILKTYFKYAETTRGFGDYGCHGVGSKIGGFSIGRVIRLVTKINGRKPFYCYQSLDEMESTGLHEASWIDYNESTIEDEMQSQLLDEFYDKICGEHGTMCVIDDIDKIGDIDVDEFNKKLKSQLELFYSKIIENGFTIRLKNEVIEPISYIGSTTNEDIEPIHLCDDIENFYFHGMEIKLDFWYCPQYGSSKSYDIPNSQTNSGVYFFRENRLINKGVHISNKATGNRADGHHTGYRIMVYLRGDSEFDKLVGGTFNKTSNEMLQMNDEFHSFLEMECVRYRKKYEEIRKALITKGNRKVKNEQV